VTKDHVVLAVDPVEMDDPGEEGRKEDRGVLRVKRETQVQQGRKASPSQPNACHPQTMETLVQMDQEVFEGLLDQMVSLENVGPQETEEIVEDKEGRVSVADLVLME